ncbi:MAG: dockerin type I repeat-containing protein [Ruminococcus flavefaciens]
MMDYKEMASIVKERGDAVIAEKTVRARRRKSIVLSVSALAATAAAAFCIWHNKDTVRYMAPHPDNGNIIEEAADTTSSPAAVPAATAEKTAAVTNKRTYATTTVTKTAPTTAAVRTSASAVSSAAVTSSAAAVYSSAEEAAVSIVPAETTAAVTAYDHEFVYNEGRVLMKRFAALSTALLSIANMTQAAADGNLQYNRTDELPDYVKNFARCVEECDLDLDFNGDGKFDIFDDYAYYRCEYSSCPDYIKEKVNACDEKMKAFSKETGIQARLSDLPEYFIYTQPMELEYFDPDYYIDNCPDTYDEIVPLEYIRHGDGKFGIKEYYDSMFYIENDDGFVRIDYHTDDYTKVMSQVHYFIEYRLKGYMCFTNASYKMMCDLMDEKLVDTDINSDGEFNYDDIMLLYSFGDNLYDDYYEDIFGYWDENDGYHELDPAPIHAKKRTYAGYTEDYDKYIAFLEEFPWYNKDTDYQTNHKLTESEWNKATDFYDIASKYSLHCFKDIDQTLFIYYITHYNVDPIIFDESIYQNNKDRYLGDNLWGYMYTYKDICETYGVNAVRAPEDTPVDLRFARYDTEKMFPEYYAAVKNGELPEPDINRNGRIDIQDYAFFQDLFNEIEIPGAPSYMIYVTIDAPQAVRDAFNNDYDFNGNGVSCDLGELECIELYIANELGAADYSDVGDMLKKYYADNPDLDPMVKLDEIIRSMSGETEEKIRVNSDGENMQGYMSSLEVFKGIDGDANLDGSMDISDAVFIMQSISNPDKYTLTPRGRKNADSNSDGVTNGDALNIQKKLLMLD